MITEATERLLRDALNKTWVMRKAQREYFKSRTVRALEESKRLERECDAALEEAAWAVKHGEPRPKQEGLRI